MKCEKCGADLIENSNFCIKCGAAVNKTKQKETEEEIKNLSTIILYLLILIPIILFVIIMFVENNNVDNILFILIAFSIMTSLVVLPYAKNKYPDEPIFIIYTIIATLIVLFILSVIILNIIVCTPALNTWQSGQCD